MVSLVSSGRDLIRLCGRWLDCVRQDVFRGVRMFARNPGFTFVAVLSIALGAGANCAMFSAVDALLLRPLPVRSPGEIVTVGARFEIGSSTQLRVSYPEYADLRDRSQSFRSLAAYLYLDAAFVSHPGVSREEQPKLRIGLLVTGNFFSAMGVQPALGRVFRAEEDSVPSRNAVVVLDHSLWEREFDADPAAIGRRVRINGVDFTVIGVLPEGFPGPNQFTRLEFYIPAMMWPRVASPGQDPLHDRHLRSMTAKGRLKPGVTLEAANAETAIIAADLRHSYPDSYRGVQMAVQSEFQTRVRESPPVAVFSAMSVVLSVAVLVVACANLSGLLLSRAPIRAREIALRLAMGAPRVRLVRQLVTENLLLAAVGGVLGLALGDRIIQFLRRIQIATDLPILVDFQFDLRVLAYCFSVAIVTVFAFGFIPALQTTRAALSEALNNRSGAAVGRGRRWGRNALVVVQVAVALVLLTIAGSVYRTLSRDLASGPGFRTDHLLLMTVNPGLTRYSVEQAGQFYDRLKEEASGIPGVRTAALTSVVPLSLIALDGVAMIPEGYGAAKGGEQAQTLRTHMAARVDEDYFDTMAIPVVRGRGFRRTDDADAPLVAVVNQALAERYWPGRDAVGQRFRRDSHDGPWVEIVGVARTSKYLMPLEPPSDYVYLPLRQSPSPGQATLLVQSAADPSELAAPLRQAIARLDRNQPVYNVQTMERFYRTSTASFGIMQLQIVAGMGLAGLLLSMVGLYGLVAYSANRRTREIGIRIAVGASPVSVLWNVMRQGLWLAGAGVALGIIAGRGMDRMMAAAFPDLSVAEPAVYLFVAPGLIAVALLAAYLPARRASRVDPTVALRNE